MATRMQQRRGTAQQWTDADPILAAGEIGFETDTNQFKIGDGVNAWSDLSYFKNLEDLGGSLDDYVLESTKGQANGVAELDGSGKIPSSQIPALVGLDTEITTAVSTAVSNLVDGAPAALNTLNEISAVLGDPSNITGNIISQLGELDGIANSLGTDVSNLETAVAGVQTDVSALETTVASHATAITGNTDALANQADDISTLSGSVTDHIADTMGVHGIANTAELATQSYADDVAETAQTNAETNAAATADSKISTHNDDTTNVHGIANTANLATNSSVSTAVSDHNADSTNVHGIADTADLATKSYADQAETDAIAAAGTAADGKISTAVAALTKSSVGLGNVDNTADADKPVSTAQASAIATAKSEAISAVNDVIASAPAALNTLDELAAALGDDANFATTVTNGLAAKAPLANPTFTGTVTLPAEGIVFSDGTQAKAGVPSITTFATAISSSATIASGEQDKFVPLTGAVTITLPATGYSTGQSIDFYQASGTGAQFASTNSVVGTPGLKFRTTNSVATAMKTSSGWLVFGDLSA